jgi:hypothetical protein
MRAMLALAVVTVGCGGEGGARAFVSGGEGPFVGIVGDDARLTAYVCDGADDAITVAAWFDGAVEADAFVIDGDANTRIEGTFDGSDEVTGTVTLADGSTFDFGGDPAPVGDDAFGLFRDEATAEDGSEVLAGWIVLDGGEQRGGVTSTTSGQTFPGPAINSNANIASVDFRFAATSVTLQPDNALNAYLKK